MEKLASNLKEYSNDDFKSITDSSANDALPLKEIYPQIEQKTEIVNNLNKTNQNNIERREFLETNFKEIVIAQCYDEKVVQNNIQKYREKFDMVKNHMNLIIKQIDFALFQNIHVSTILGKDVLNSQKRNFDNLKKLIKDMIGISGVLSSLNQVSYFFSFRLGFVY